MFSIFKKDFFGFLNSSVGYIAIGLFLLVTGLFLWVFPETSVLDYGYATLESFFSMSPYIFMFLIPAITMKSIAGEREDGTYEWLMTKPISLGQLLVAKYLSCLAVVTLAIIPTVVYYSSIYFLGSPQGNIDTGAVIGSYIGLLLLGASFAAIGIFISAISNNIIVAFLLSAFLCFCTFIGIDYLANLLDEEWSAYLLYLSINTHYASISRGVADLRDLAFFLCYCLLFLCLAYTFIEKGRAHISQALKRLSVVLSVLVAINALVGYFFFRIDFTNEKRYTISESSKDVLRSLTDDIHIVVFLEGDLPAGFQRLKNATRDMLADLKAYAGGQIKYTFINPVAENESGQQEAIEALAKRGIEPTRLSVKTTGGLTQKIIYPVAVLMYGNNELPIPLLQNNRFISPEEVLNNAVQNLEYVFVNGIKKITSGGKPIVAFTEGHGELTDLELYDAMHSLSSGYQAGRLNLDAISLESLAQIKVIVVAQPKSAFSELHKFKLDYFIQHGGKVLWAINQADAALDNMRKTGSQVVVAKTLNLDDMLFKYGVRLNYNLLADLNCAQIPLSVGKIGGADQFQLVPWMFYPLFIPKSQHPIIKNIDGIKGEFAGTLDTLPTKIIKKAVILSSSPFSKVLRVPVPISLDMVSKEPESADFKGGPYPVGVVLTGAFPSIFKNRPVPEGIIDTLSNEVHAVSPNKMIVLADGNVLKNEINQEEQVPYDLGWDRATQQQYGNKVFFLNMIDYLCDEKDIISLREKEVKLRLLDKVSIKQDRSFWQLINVCAPLLLLLCMGLMQQIIRKRKFG